MRRMLKEIPDQSHTANSVGVVRPNAQCMRQRTSAALAKVAAKVADCLRSALPDSQLLEMIQKIGGILVDAVSAGVLKLRMAVAAREEAHSKRLGSLSREQVPYAVADDEAF